ncbi:MAG: hypothetical protein IIU77_03285, partial [Clostridia bacterium]|nr:hypothetical protein [Clostridia bacterium]
IIIRVPQVPIIPGSPVVLLKKVNIFDLQVDILSRLYTKKPNSSIPNREILSQNLKKAEKILKKELRCDILYNVILFLFVIKR